MSALLKVVGGIWAIVGSANIVMMFRNDASSNIGAFQVLLNFVLFILPGWALYGIGAAIGRSRPLLIHRTVPPRSLNGHNSMR